MKMIKKGLSWVLVAALLMVTGVCQPAQAARDCGNSIWQKANTAQHSGYGYPETTSATYWGYHFENAPGLSLQVSGRFPKARYMAYTLYNVDAGDHQGSNITIKDKFQHLTDEEIKPKEGDVNPYKDKADRDAVNRAYEIWVIRSDSDYMDDPDKPNKLVIPKDIGTVSLFLRVYLPDNPGKTDLALQGDVELPKITVHNKFPEEEKCPDALEFGGVNGIIDPNAIIKRERLDENGILLRDDSGNDIDRIESFRPGPAGLFPNGDAPYLVSPLKPFSDTGKIAVLRFKAPKFPDTRGGDGFNENDSEDPDQVRYWSVCIGDWEFTQSGDCIADQDIPVDDEGYVHLLIGPDGLINQNTPNWINLRWSWPRILFPNQRAEIPRPILIFRQISVRKSFDDEKHSFNKTDIAFNETGVEDVHVSMADLYLEKKHASFDIQEYAPIGTYCTIEQWDENKCGIDDILPPTDGSISGCGN